MSPHGPAIIYGVESEEVEEINDAYNDLIADLGALIEYTEECFPLYPRYFQGDGGRL